MPSDRTASQSFALALGRLRACVRAHPARVEQALELAADAGQRAYAAGVPLTQLVEVLAGLVPGTAPDTRALPARLIEAAATDYLDAESAQCPGDPSGPAAS